jgi:energy-coupling factor transporter transmembrane protein EcfT
MEMNRAVTSLVSSDKPASEPTDIAAVLIAVLVVAIGPLSDQGAWTWMNMATALLVLVVLAAYSWSSFLHSPPFKLFALALVFWTILTIGLAWPAQQYIVHGSPRSEREWIVEFYRCGNTEPVQRIANGCREPAFDAYAEQALGDS